MNKQDWINNKVSDMMYDDEADELYKNDNIDSMMFYK